MQHQPQRLALAVAVTALAMTADVHAVVTTPATAYGALSNFDVYNDSGSHYVGFEIELHGLHKSAIPTYGVDNTPAVFQISGGYIPSVFEIGDATNFSTILRYSGYDAGGTLIHSTAPFDFASQQVATDGHSCVFASGCEHFGMGYYGNPSSIRYQWLLPGAAPGEFTPGAIVQLGDPVWNVRPPANPEAQQVEVEVEVHRPEQENENEAAPPRWVKVFIDKAHKNGDVIHDALDPNDAGREMQARLNGLMSGRDDVVPQGHLGVDKDGNEIEVPENEYEWELLTDNEPPKVRGKVMAADELQLVRRFEFYDFAGSVEQLALCSASGKKPDECDPNVNPDLVGHLIGAQMGALNLDLLAPVEPAPVPLPPGLPAMLSGLVALALIGRRRNPLL